MEAILSDKQRRTGFEDPPAQSFTRPPAEKKNRLDRTPPPADRWSAAPAPPRRVTNPKPEATASRPGLGEIGAGIAHELIKNWQRGVCVAMAAFWVALIVAGHAVWSFTSLPDDHYLSTERRAEQLAPGFRWEGSRYGLLSALRCPHWEAASFRLVSQTQGDEAPHDMIMCCTAETTPDCHLLSEP